MNLVPEQAAFLIDICNLIPYATDMGFVVTGGELYRTAEQQDFYVEKGLSKTRNSNHLRRCAIDLNFFKNDALCYDIKILQPLGDFWESLNPKNSWGGNWIGFKDVPHFERRL